MRASVLLVDDDPAFRQLARRMLTAAGLDVVGEADTVATAIAAARELRPDSALIDIGLPDGNGLDLAGELKALPSAPRIILMSTDADAAGPEDVSRCGAARFVPKVDLPLEDLDRLLVGE